jgi:hypothetical protein
MNNNYLENVIKYIKIKIFDFLQYLSHKNINNYNNNEIPKLFFIEQHIFDYVIQKVYVISMHIQWSFAMKPVFSKNHLGV